MKKFSLLLCSLLFVATSIFAQDIMSGKKMSDKIPNDPTVKYGTFENGLTYYIKENKYPENRADLQLMILAGSLDEEQSQWGLAHFTEHMCFNGTKNFPKNELVNYFESIGMTFGGDLNANTSYDRTIYTIQLPTDDKKIVDNGVQILEDWLHNVSFDQDELDKERGVILEEWRVRSGAMGRYYKHMFDTYGEGSMWAKRNVIGDTNVILRAPRERFTSFYNDWYRPNRSAIVAVGDFDKDEMFKIIKKKFANIKNPKNEKKNVTRDIPEHKGIRTSIFVDKEWSNPTIVGLTVVLPEVSSETYAGYKTGIERSLASVMLNARFQEYTQEEDCPLMQGVGSIGGFVANWDAFSMQGVAKEGKTKEAFDFMVAEAFRAKQHGFTAGELKRAKEQIMAMIDKYYNERDKAESGNYAREYFTHFQENSCYPGIEYEKQLYDKFMPEIQLKDVNNLIASVIKTDHAILSVATVEKEGNVVPTKKELNDLFLASSKKSYEPYVDSAIDKPLMSKIPTPGKVVKEEKIAEIDAVKWTLSNGAQVYLKSTDFKNDEIRMRSFAWGGTSLAPTSNLNNAENASSIINEGGLGEFDNVQLQKVLTGKRVSVYPYIAENSMGIAGNSTKKDITTFFQMLNMYFTAPRTDAKSFSVYKKNAIESWEAAQQNPSNAMRDAMTLTLYDNHPRRQPSTREEIETLDMNKAMKFYKEQFDGAGQFTFVFVGSLDMAVMKTMVETYIGSLPKGSTKSFKDNNIRYVKGQKSKKVYKGMDPKANIYQVCTGKADYNYETIFKMNALSKLLNIRLREEVREKEGATYSIGAWVSPVRFPVPAYQFGINFTTAPDRLDEILKKTAETISNVKAGKFEDDNVAKIKKQMIRKRETDLKKNSFWLNSIYNRLYNDQDFAIINQYNKYIETVTKKSLVKTANKYCVDKNKVEIIQLPEDMKK